MWVSVVNLLNLGFLSPLASLNITHIQDALDPSTLISDLTHTQTP